MRRLFQRVRACLPQRKRWRYVSGRRRRRGVALMTLTILALYGWWHFTNDARIKQKAVAYLERLTGVDVRVQHASFSVFNGIELTGVRIFQQANGGVEDILQAREVRLEHRPLSLLRAGRLAVTEIICVEPTLTIAEDVDRGTWNYQSLFRWIQLADPSSQMTDLPDIRIRDGRVIRKEILHGAIVPLCEERLSARATYVAGTRQYHIEVQGDQADEPTHAAAILSLAPVSFAWDGDVPATLLRRSLPHGYRQWLETYQVGGVFGFQGNRGGDSDQDRLVLTLTNASMALSPADGGVQLIDLNGEIELTAGGIRIVESVTGRLPQFGGASVEVRGSFDGYEKTSPVNVSFEITGLQFPLEFAAGLPGRFLGMLHRQFRPVGKMALTVHVGRDADGKVSYRGTARPQGMSATVSFFPAPLTEVQGEATFDSEQVMLERLVARSGDTLVEITGTVQTDNIEAPHFDVRIVGQQVALGDPMREVLAASSLRDVRGAVLRYHDRFSLEGICGVDVHMYTEPSGKIRTELDLGFDGNASGSFDGFPYRVDRLSGTVAVRPDHVDVEALRGHRGKASVRFDGKVNTKPSYGLSLTLAASDVALDEHLEAGLATLSPEFRRQYDAFALAGVADINGTLTQVADERLGYDLTVTLKNASMEYTPFPYRLDEVFGVLQLAPKAIEVRRLAARHGDGQVGVSGRVDLTGPRATPELVIDARQIRFDEDLRRAVEAAPAFSVAGLWDQLQPSGTADFLYELHGRPQGDHSYSLKLTPRNMSVTYQAFPYTLTNLRRGEVFAQPGRVELRDLVSGPDSSPITLSGVVHTDGDRVESADLALDAMGLPIDSRLLQAAPQGLRSVADLLRPGGQCEIHLTRLAYRSVLPAPPAQDAAPTTQPAADSPYDGPWRWVVEGDIRFADAALHARVPATNVYGSIVGGVRVDDGRGGMQVDARLEADSLMLWGRQTDGLTGHIIKRDHEANLQLAQLTANFCGGRLGGGITVELADPCRYTAALIMEDAQLAPLLAVGTDGASGEMGGSGRLSGRLDLSETVGQADQREGRGQFRISEAKIGKVPILVGLMNVIFLQLPTESAFSTGTVEYYIKGDKLFCSRIYLEVGNLSVVGPTSIVGTGVVDMQTGQMNLVFRSGPSHLLKGVFSELWTLTAQGLSSTHVTGTLRDPKVQTVPFSQVTRLLKEMGGMD